MKNSRIRHCEYCGANIITGLKCCPVCKTKLSLNTVSMNKNVNMNEEDENIKIDTYLDEQDRIDEQIGVNELKCNKCGQAIESDWEICPTCGNSIAKEERQDDDNSKEVIFVVLYIAFLLTTLVTGPISLVASLVIAITGKLSCPKSNLMTVIFALSISLFVGALIFVALTIYTCLTCNVG